MALLLLCAALPLCRYSPGVRPTTRLNALLNAASDSYPADCAIGAVTTGRPSASATPLRIRVAFGHFHQNHRAKCAPGLGGWFLKSGERANTLVKYKYSSGSGAANVALSQRRARKVAVVPLIAISRIPGGNHHGGRRGSCRTCVAFVGCC